MVPNDLSEPNLRRLENAFFDALTQNIVITETKITFRKNPERKVEVCKVFVSLSETIRTVKLILLEFIIKSYNQVFRDPHSKLVFLGCFFVSI